MNGTKEQHVQAARLAEQYVQRSVVVYACIITALTCTNIGLGFYTYLQQRNIESLRAELTQSYRSTLATLKEQNRILKTPE